MKKSFLLGALVFFGIMNAQIGLGVKAGYTLSDVYLENNNNTDMKSSFYLGGFAEYNLGSKLNFQGELVYSPLGYRSFEERGLYYSEESLKNDQITKNDKYKIKKENIVTFHTLMLPLSLKYNLVDKLSVAGGVNIQWAFKNVLRRKEQFDSKTRVLEKQKEYVDEGINELTLAPFVGLSYDVYKQLFIEARYNHGVMSIVKGLDVYNKYFEFGLGYKF